MTDERDVVERQRADDDCTICSIAMATGLPYERVMEVAAQSVGGYRYQGKPGTMSPKGVLIDLGIEAVRVGVEAIQPATLKRLLWGRRAILSVPSINGFAGHHDVYWDGRVICDPSHKATYAPDALGDLRPIWAVVVDEVSELEALRGERDEFVRGERKLRENELTAMERAFAAEARAQAAEASLREVQAHLLRIERAWRDQVSTTESKLLLEDVLATPHRGEEGKQGLSSSSVAESGGSRAQEPVKSDSHSHIEKEDL